MWRDMVKMFHLTEHLENTEIALTNMKEEIKRKKDFEFTIEFYKFFDFVTRAVTRKIRMAIMEAYRRGER